jgi:hypothetical protein
LSNFNKNCIFSIYFCDSHHHKVLRKSAQCEPPFYICEQTDMTKLISSSRNCTNAAYIESSSDVAVHLILVFYSKVHVLVAVQTSRGEAESVLLYGSPYTTQGARRLTLYCSLACNNSPNSYGFKCERLYGCGTENLAKTLPTGTAQVFQTSGLTWRVKSYTQCSGSNRVECERNYQLS